VQAITLNIFDSSIAVSSNVQGFLDVVTALHGRALCPNGAAASPSATFAYLRNEGGGALLALNGRVYHLAESPNLDVYAYGQLAFLMTRYVTSHALLHAAAMSHQGSGVVLVAESFHGKTTLALELARRGFQLMSDDIAALNLHDYMVYPFPRALFIRPKTLELVGLPTPDSSFRFNDKVIVEVEDLVPYSWTGTPVPVGHVIVLDTKRRGAPLPRRDNLMSVTLGTVDDRFLRNVEQLSNIDSLKLEYQDNLPVLLIETTHKVDTLRAIERLCDEQEVLVLDYQRQYKATPNFQGNAACVAIPRSEAAFALLGSFRAGHHSMLLERAASGSSARLLMGLAGIVRQATAHRLEVGPLAQNADLVCDLVTGRKE
jgi:hypothetical protein